MRRWAEHPGVLAAATLAAVDDQLSLGQGHPGKPAGQHPDVLAIVDRERPKIDMAGLQAVLDQRWHGGQLDYRLRDPTARVLCHPIPERIKFSLGGPRPDHDAFTARAVSRLDDSSRRSSTSSRAASSSRRQVSTLAMMGPPAGST